MVSIDMKLLQKVPLSNLYILRFFLFLEMFSSSLHSANAEESVLLKLKKKTSLLILLALNSHSLHNSVF